MENEHSLLSNDQPAADRTPWVRIGLLVTLATAVVTLMLAAFAGAGASLEPRDVPLAVAGPAPAVEAVTDRLEAARPGAFEVVAAADADAARDLVGDREVYGAVLLGGSGPVEVLTASAASAPVATVLAELGATLGVPVADVVPLPDDDPRGAVFGAAALPITVGGIALGTLAALAVRGRGRRLAAIAGGALAVGLAVVGVVHGWLGALAGDWWVEAGVVALGVLAIATVLAGIHSVAGRVGLVLADLVLVLVGNPFSAATSAPVLLPEPWSTMGHWLPLGATVDALRGVSGFDGAGTMAPLLVLAGWAALGLTLLAVRRHPRPATRPSDEERAEPARAPVAVG